MSSFIEWKLVWINKNSMIYWSGTKDVGGYRTLSDPSMVTGIYLWIPFPSSLTSELAHLTYQWPLPWPACSNITPFLLPHKQKWMHLSPVWFRSSFIWRQSCTLGLKLGLGALERMSVRCRSLIKAAWPHHHAVISAHLHIRQAWPVDAWPHEHLKKANVLNLCARESEAEQEHDTSDGMFAYFCVIEYVPEHGRQ